MSGVRTLTCHCQPAEFRPDRRGAARASRDSRVTPCGLHGSPRGRGSPGPGAAGAAPVGVAITRANRVPDDELQGYYAKLFRIITANPNRVNRQRQLGTSDTDSVSATDEIFIILI